MHFFIVVEVDTYIKVILYIIFFNNIYVYVDVNLCGYFALSFIITKVINV